MQWLWLAAFWLEAPDVGRCASITNASFHPRQCDCCLVKAPRGLTSCLIGLRESDMGVVMRSTSELPIMLGP